MHTLSILIRFVGDALFPPSRDALLVRDAKLHDLVLLISRIDARGIEALLPFSAPLVRAAVHEAKFHGSGKAFALLGAVLHERLMLMPQKDCLLIPVPLSGSRKRQRGYNQAAEIAKAAVHGLPHVAVREDIVKRTRNTKPQTKLTKEARLSNMEHAFAVEKPDAIKQRHVILFDDVVTTGATLDAAKSAILRHSPASVTVIALAH